jgi:AraC family transcriptional regulator of adaptative response/methylated-DNA-[protein]-cysteine methyltransferase
MSLVPQAAPRGPLDEDARWQAVLTRDRQADSWFLYGVRTTGVYCRPSCASRKPSRAFVTFFDSAGEAERAGFRACKRCRPGEGTAVDPWVAKVRRACLCLARATEMVTLRELAARVGGSPYHLQRNFKRLVGVSPRAFGEACRLHRMKHRLRGGSGVTTALFDAGYGSTGRFYERGVPRLGMTPSQYKKGGAGMHIGYTVIDSPIGKLLVGATERGVCAVAIGASTSELKRQLEREYPRASIAPDPLRLERFATQVVAHLAGRVPSLDLPLDLQATAFQWQVWTELMAIPRGERRSYGEVAAALGRPRASRAVARACASNPVALAIPCHRVVPSAGGVGGYRWGPARKKALLALENAQMNG